MRWNLTFFGLIALIIGGLLWLGNQKEPRLSNHIQPFITNTESMARGKALYQQNCASCHGVNLEGQPNWKVSNSEGILPAPPHDETGHTWHHSDEVLFNYTKFGGQGFARRNNISSLKSGMPAFAGVLDDDEIKTTLNYIKSTWPAKVMNYQSELSP